MLTTLIVGVSLAAIVLLAVLGFRSVKQAVKEAAAVAALAELGQNQRDEAAERACLAQDGIDWGQN